MLSSNIKKINRMPKMPIPLNATTECNFPEQIGNDDVAIDDMRASWGDR